MKIASDYYNKGPGKSLSFLVDALVLGTAFPHILKGFIAVSTWKPIIIVTSAIAVLGGLCISFLVPDGPHKSQPKPSTYRHSRKCLTTRRFELQPLGILDICGNSMPFGHLYQSF